MTRTLAEQETIIGWDRAEGRLHLWTANPHEAARWRRKGWILAEHHGGWWAEGPVDALTLRRVSSGAVWRRRGGERLFLAKAGPGGAVEVGARP
jgi:hypothetical protein